MLWGDWRVCTFETLWLPLAKRRFFENLPSIVFTTPSVPLVGTETFLTLKEGFTFLTKPLFNSLYAPFGSPSSGGQKPSGTRGCNRPTVLYLPHLSLPSGRVLNPLPSPRPFQKGKGCNRPPVLRTATLYGCRTIKGLRHVVRDGTAWGKVDRIIEVLVLW